MASQKEIATLIIGLRAEVDDLKRGINQATRQTGKYGKRTKATLGQIKTSWLAIAGAVAVVTREFRKSIKVFSDFKQATAEVNTLLDVSTKQFKSMEKGIISMTRRVPQTAKELTSALYDIVSAGVDASDSLKVLEQSARAAVAGVTDTKTASRAAIGVMNAYGKTVDDLDEIYDVLFKTVKKGVTTFPELSQNIGVVLPIARAAGVSFQDVAASIAAMTKAGIQTPLAVTFLKNAIKSLASPTEQAKESMAELGITWQGLIPTMREIARRGIELDQMRMIVPDVRAAQGILSLSQNIDTLNESVYEIQNSAGAAEEAYAKMADTPEAKIKDLANAIDEFRIAVVNAFTQGNINAVGLMAKAFRGLAAAVQQYQKAASIAGSLFGGESIETVRIRRMAEETEDEVKLFDKLLEKSKEREKVDERIVGVQKAINEGRGNEEMLLRNLELNQRKKLQLMKQEAILRERLKELTADQASAEAGDTTTTTTTTTTTPAAGSAGKKVPAIDIEKRRAQVEVNTFLQKLKLANREDELEKQRTATTLENIRKVREAHRQALKERRQKEEENFVASMEEAHQIATNFISAYQNIAQANMNMINKRREEEKSMIRLQGLSAEAQTQKIEEIDKKYDEKIKKQFNMEKTLAQAQIAVDTAMAIVRLWAQPGFPAAIPLMASVTALSAAQIAKVQSQKMAEGGMLQGPSHSAGGIPIEAEGGEYVHKKRAVNYYGTEAMNAINNMLVPKSVLENFTSHMRPGASGGRYFAEGGAVTSTIRDRMQANSDVKIVNFVDPNLFDKYMQTYEGQNSIINAIAERSSDVRSVL